MSWKITRIFSSFLTVLTDQQAQVQAINKVYHEWTIIKCIIIIIKLNNCNLIQMMCVPLGIFGFLFLCNLDGKCVPFYVWVKKIIICC